LWRPDLRRVEVAIDGFLIGLLPIREGPGHTEGQIVRTEYDLPRRMSAVVRNCS